MPKGIPATETMTTETVIILKWMHKQELWGVYDMWCEARLGYRMELIDSLECFEIYWLNSLKRASYEAKDIVKEQEKQADALPRKVY